MYQYFEKFLQKEFNIFIIVPYLLLFSVAYIIFYFFFHTAVLPSSENLVHWDSGWYKSIVEEGYFYRADSQSNIPFFPLFPFLWKFLGVNALVMSIINGTIFLTGFYLLAKLLQFKNWEALLYLSMPSMFFCYMPYSEAIFFLTSTLIIIGFHKKNLLATSVGIIISSIARSASMLFLPAITFTELMFIKDKSIKVFWFRLLALVAASLAGLVIVIYIQYTYTGEWFAIFNALEHWERNLKIPQLPLTTWGGAKFIWLDGFSLFISILAIAFAIYIAIKWLYSNFQSTDDMNKSVLFSTGYLIMTGLTTIFFSPIYPEGTSLMSINRYVLATPYFMVFFHYYFNNWRWNKNSIVVTVGLLIGHLFLIGIFSSIYQKVFFDINTLLEVKSYLIIIVGVLLYASLKNENNITLKTAILFSGQIAAQVYLLHMFLNERWVG